MKRHRRAVGGAVPDAATSMAVAPGFLGSMRNQGNIPQPGLKRGGRVHHRRKK
jgi:hypothetical protein